jgi:hypothetical protein
MNKFAWYVEEKKTWLNEDSAKEKRQQKVAFLVIAAMLSLPILASVIREVSR